MTTPTLLISTVIMLTFAFAIQAEQSAASSAATRTLLGAMSGAGLEAVATADPDAPGAFVAALHIKGGQLLVVRAHHPSVDALAARLAARQYRDVYIDLQATPTATGKLFVMDSGADGLPADADQPEHVDVVYHDGTRHVMFNGARQQKLSREEYRTQLEDADAKYTRLLNVLTDSITGQSQKQPAAMIR